MGPGLGVLVNVLERLGLGSEKNRFAMARERVTLIRAGCTGRVSEADYGLVLG